MSLLLVLLVIVAAGIIQAVLENQKRGAATQLLQHQRASQVTALAGLRDSLPGFREAEHIVSADRQQLIALDKTGKQVAFCQIRDGQAHAKVYPFKSIVEVSIEENGQILTQTKVSRGSQASGALVGSVLLGPAGLIVGGLSGTKNSTTTEVVTSLDLKIMVDDLDSPLWSIRYFGGVSPRDGTVFVRAREAVQHWHALLSIVIRQNSDVGDAPLLHA